MNPRGRLRFAATLAATSQALATVVSDLAPLTPADDLHAVELGLAEVLTNLARHGFDGADAGCINVHWAAQAGRVDLHVTDGGRPIPRELLSAAAHKSFDYESSDLQDLPESGFGLAIVLQVFDSVDYRSRGGVNRLRLCRHCGAPR